MNPQDTRQQWLDFCDQLKSAADVLVQPGVPDDDKTQQEGLRYLTRLLRLSLEKNLEFGDPHKPAFYSLSHETAKIGNDNPDNYYQNCAVDGRCDYIISGHRGSVAYMSIESKAGSFAGGGDMAPTGHIELADLAIDEDGKFELIVSATPHSGNWLPMQASSDNLLVRQTFNVRQQEQTAQLSIRCINPPFDEGEVFDLSAVVPFVSGTASLFKSWMDVFARHINQLPPNDQAMCVQAGGDPSIYYHNSFWQLQADEALVIRFTPPKQCRTWNFQLSNYWMESLDYRFYPISFNQHTAVQETDGSICLVVAHTKPGAQYPNWVDTVGHSSGAMLLRYVEAADYPPVSTELVSLASLS